MRCTHRRYIRLEGVLSAQGFQSQFLSKSLASRPYVSLPGADADSNILDSNSSDTNWLPQRPQAHPTPSQKLVYLQ